MADDISTQEAGTDRAVIGSLPDDSSDGVDLIPPLPLNDAQEAFCQHYRLCFNATRAAIEAGYSPRSAASQGQRLLRNAKVVARLAQLARATSRRVGLEADDVIQEAMRIAFSDMGDFASWGADGVRLKDSDELPSGASRCVAEVSETVTRHGGAKRLKLHDKVQALDMLFRHLALYGGDLNGPDRPPVKNVLIVLGQRIEF
jgi:phage terminase small subunit